MKGRYSFIFFSMLFTALALSGCKPRAEVELKTEEAAVSVPVKNDTALIENKVVPTPAAPVEITLETQIITGRMVFVGIGGEIDGVVNPDLLVQPGTTILATLINGDGIPHDLAFPDFKAASSMVMSKGKTTEMSFTVGEDKAGTYAYFCTLPGHRQAGQEGRLIVMEP